MRSVLGRITGLSFFTQVWSPSKGDFDSLRWLLVVRASVAAGFLVALLATMPLFNTPIELVSSLALVALTFIACMGTYALILRNNPTPRTVRILKQMQIPVDVLLCTGAIYISGGVLTPMFALYTLPILVSIILLDPRGVYYTASFSLSCYSALMLLESERAIPYLQGYWGGANRVQAATPTVYAVYLLAVGSLIIAATYMANHIARIVVNRNSQIESQVHDLQALYEVANGLGSIMDEGQMLRYLANRLKVLQSASICIIGMVGQDGKVEIAASAGVPPELLTKLRNIHTTTPELEALLQKGEAIIVEDLGNRPDLMNWSLNPTTKSICVYPIKSEARVLGAVSLSFDRRKPLSPEYNHLMLTIASQAGIALQRARLFRDMQRLANQMSTLYDVGLYTGSTLSSQEVLRRTADTMEKLMNPDAYYIALYDDNSRALSFEVCVEKGQQLPRMNVPLGEGSLTGHIIESCTPLLVQDWSKHRDREQFEAIVRKQGADMASYLGVPMMWEGQVIGVVSVQAADAMAFDEQDERMLSALANQAAIALQNANLHQVAQEQAALDSLTRVYNHGHFFHLICKAVESAGSDDAEMAVIMLDIDYFKQYNDTFGHIAGDNVLQQVAQAIKGSVRSTDAVGRWGGEEFGVLLIGCGADEARRVANHIRQAIAAIRPVDARGQEIIAPTVSQGISAYPRPSGTASQLIDHADTALYHAKERGRNQLVIFQAAGGVKGITVTTGELRDTGPTLADVHSDIDAAVRAITSPNLRA